jgi:hypothetical protein
MYIVSKFRDFYDPCMSLGIDKTVMYHRTTTLPEQPNKIRDKDLCDIINRLPSSTVTSHEVMRGRVLLICGEAIPFVEIELEGKAHHFYSVDKATDFIYAKGIRLNRQYFWWSRHCVHSINGIKHFLEDKTFSGLTRLHHIHKCPVIIVKASNKGEHVILNPNLKSIGYQTQKDPYTLFQSIYMFLSGVLGTPMKEPRPISDEIKAANHGLDGQYSFKNLPGKKRGRNK